MIHESTLPLIWGEPTIFNTYPLNLEIFCNLIAIFPIFELSKIN
ncbi:hypothetical protein VL20_1155 [Microcystis panniformis FACHB-1757]|uniref:Uncharacterized protein n=1 Tax=Microcystis panniformis FACHB-1757 TaxID=1638788 RepID=A0A0K1RXA9_9CHRO|nr:hypothetical protein VL20_1155 [Microcystis panniformis FACHB-1757]